MYLLVDEQDIVEIDQRIDASAHVLARVRLEDLPERGAGIGRFAGSHLDTFLSVSGERWAGDKWWSSLTADEREVNDAAGQCKQGSLELPSSVLGT